jgi:hypothetical protein
MHIYTHRNGVISWVSLYWAVLYFVAVKENLAHEKYRVFSINILVLERPQNGKALGDEQILEGSLK